MRLLLALLLFACPFQLIAFPYPSTSLSHLLALLEIPCSDSLSSIIDATQKRWIQTGKERWEFEQKDEDKREELIPLFKEIGMVEESHAACKNYDYALIHGGFYARVQKRVRYLINEYRRGVRFNTVVLLTGQRFLDPNTSEGALPFKTETEMVLFVWENTEMPAELRALPVVLVDAPQQTLPNGQRRRPGTKETILTWIETHPMPGQCLCISSQPFCGYQDSVAQTCLPSSFTVETIGDRAEDNIPISNYLDNLARWLYQEGIRKN